MHFVWVPVTAIQTHPTTLYDIIRTYLHTYIHTYIHTHTIAMFKTVSLTVLFCVLLIPYYHDISNPHTVVRHRVLPHPTVVCVCMYVCIYVCMYVNVCSMYVYVCMCV